MGKGRLIEALGLAGSQHKYQQILLFLLCFVWIQRVFIFLCAPYIYMDPIFHCQSKGTHIVHQKQACKMIDQCNIVDNFTLTSELGLYCDLQWARLTIQSIFPIGSFAGLMIINLISDTRGRRTAILLDLVIAVCGVLFSLVGGNQKNVYFLILSQFLNGFGGYSLISLGYTILADFFSDHFRHIGIVVISAIAGCGVMVIGLLYNLGLYWLYFILYFQFIPLIVLTGAFFFFLFESPYVLMNHNHQLEAEQVLCKIAVFNGRKDQVVEIRRIIEEEQRDKTHKPTLKKIFKMIKQWRFLKPIIILVTVNGIGNLNYFGIVYAFGPKGLGFGYNNMIFGFVQLSSIFFSKYAVKNIPRRYGIMFFYGAVMVTCLMFGFDFVQNSIILSSIMFAVYRLLAIVGYCLVVCMETQAFSVYIQSTAAGLIEGFGLYGAVFAPLVVQVAHFFDIDPVVLIGLFGVFSVVPAFYLPETFQTPPILDEPKSSTVLSNLNQSLNISYQQIQLANRMSNPQRKLSKILGRKNTFGYSQIVIQDKQNTLGFSQIVIQDKQQKGKENEFQKQTIF